MSTTLNIILGNCTINSGNRGCVALAYTSIYLIDKILTEAGYTYHLYLPDSGFSKAGEHTINVAGKDVKYTVIPHDIHIGKKNRIKRFIRYKETVETYKIYKSSDFIIHTGQGDSCADIYGKERFDRINMIHREDMKINKKY